MANNTPTYQQLSDQLEEILEQLQSMEVDVDDAVQLFERGVKLTQQMEKHLSEAENRIKELKATSGREV